MVGGMAGQAVVVDRIRAVTRELAPRIEGKAAGKWNGLGCKNLFTFRGQFLAKGHYATGVAETNVIPSIRAKVTSSGIESRDPSRIANNLSGGVDRQQAW